MAASLRPLLGVYLLSPGEELMDIDPGSCVTFTVSLQSRDVDVRLFQVILILLQTEIIHIQWHLRSTG